MIQVFLCGEKTVRGSRNVSRIEKNTHSFIRWQGLQVWCVYFKSSVLFLQRFELAVPRASTGQQVVFYLESVVIYFKVESGF